MHVFKNVDNFRNTLCMFTIEIITQIFLSIITNCSCLYLKTLLFIGYNMIYWYITRNCEHSIVICYIPNFINFVKKNDNNIKNSCNNKLQ